MAVRELSLLEQTRLFRQLIGALSGYLQEPLDQATAHAQVRTDVASRPDNLQRIIANGVFAVPGSPYRALLEHAGATAEDVADLIRREGVEGALEQLYEAGVYVSLDEFKGRRPIIRGSLHLEVTARDFDNPLATVHYAAQSGGSRSSGTRIAIDLAHNVRSAIYDRLLFETHGVLDRPYVIWQPTLPYGAGMNAVLRYAKFGGSAARWFSQNRAPAFGQSWQHGWLTRFLVLATRWYGRPVPKPEHVPLAEAGRIAACLADLKARGTPALLNTNASSGTRVCIAAKERGLDIAGTMFRLGGEPLTPARARVVASSGSRVVTIYGMGEIGRIGLPCAHAEEVDDVHLLLDKLSVIRRLRSPRLGGPPVPVNVYTTLVSSTPKLMLNVESDDFGQLEERSCGCLLDQLGLGKHLHTIRSHEKLTSEGMNFLGHDLIRLIEEVLPARFQGAPTDFQFVEDETRDGLPQVRLLVSPRIGDVSDDDVVAAVIDFLNDLPGAGGAFGERWREGKTLRVMRREPYATNASKVLALHTMKRKQERSVHGGV